MKYCLCDKNDNKLKLNKKSGIIWIIAILTVPWTIYNVKFNFLGLSDYRLGRMIGGVVSVFIIFFIIVIVFYKINRKNSHNRKCSLYRSILNTLFLR